MSAETDLQGWLTGYAPLTALVGTSIAQNAVPQGASMPYVAWTTQHAPDYGLANNLLAEGITATLECWAEDAETADAVADQVAAALQAQRVLITARSTAFDGDLGLDATVLVAEWWL